MIKICARLAGRLLGDPSWAAGPEAGGLLSGVGRHRHGSHYVFMEEGLVENSVYLSKKCLLVLQVQYSEWQRSSGLRVLRQVPMKYLLKYWVNIVLFLPRRKSF